jgi:3-hydroxyacyl-[acyl-carrier-protein] dehydratase
MSSDATTLSTILSLVPQQKPFRYIDEIISINENEIIASYCFKDDEFFYQGHFPDHPITPGVILIEAMAQTGVVALGIYQLMLKGYDSQIIKTITPLFSFVDKVEFSAIVKPGEKVLIKAQKKYYRRGNIQSEVVIERETNELICRGVLTGSGVKLNEK